MYLVNSAIVAVAPSAIANSGERGRNITTNDFNSGDYYDSHSVVRSVGLVVITPRDGKHRGTFLPLEFMIEILYAQYNTGITDVITGSMGRSEYILSGMIMTARNG